MHFINTILLAMLKQSKEVEDYLRKTLMEKDYKVKKLKTDN